MIEPSELTTMLQAAFPDGEVQVTDLTGSRDHYRAVIVSRAFEGKGLLDRHRAVYAALGDAMKQKIHAFSFDAFTPAERSKKLT